MKTTKNERITFIVSGDTYETYSQTLKRFPDTVLEEIARSPDKRPEPTLIDGKETSPYHILAPYKYFFDRCRLCFGAVLFYYQSNGTLLCPQEVNVDVFVKECEFYRIPNKSILQMKIKEGKLPHLDDTVDTPPTETFREQIWAFIDFPETSEPARWYAIISFAIISLSIICACMETIPQLKMSDHFVDDPWSIIELTLNIWFLLEFLVRIVLCPDKKEFINSILNWIDAGAVIPYFVVPFFSDTPIINYGFLRILKFVRVMRLFRLSKHSKRLKVVGEIIKSSFPDLQLLILCFGIAVIFGGSIVYFAEKLNSEKNAFVSIPESFWWAIQAITTVGYGDIIPKTVIGRCFAAGYSILGVMTLSLPVLAIVTKFTMFYEKNVDCNPWD